MRIQILILGLKGLKVNNGHYYVHNNIPANSHALGVSLTHAG